MKMAMRTVICSVAGALAIAGVLTAAVRAQDNALPDGPAKDIVMQACAACHDTATFTSERHTAGDWSSIVSQMEDMGTSITPDQHKAIVAYLAEHYAPPGSAPADAKAPAAAGQ